MTSERSCYVYVWLPGATDAITAGRFQIGTDRRQVTVGRYVYARSYLARADAVALDPNELKLTDRTYETAALGGMFGALRDAGPDYWGRLIIERHLGRSDVDELTYLLDSPDDRAGALGFGLGPTPPAPKRQFNRTLDLARLQAAADELMADRLRDSTDAAQVERLLLLGTSMGGARPKAVVEDDGQLWIAKFNKPSDRWNNARVEQAMLLLARACGMTTAESKLVTVGDRDVLLVKRFDREPAGGGYTRARMISAMTLLRTDDDPSNRRNWSYVTLAEELRRASAVPKADAQELFRRMVFNGLISNIDDHPRNHALLARDTAWRLSPAYDLTPATPISDTERDLAMIVGRQGRWANAGNMLSEAARFLLTPEEARHIVDDLTAIVDAQWYPSLKASGVTDTDAGLLRNAFNYSGFHGSGNGDR